MTNLKEAYTSHVLIGTPGRLVDLIETDEQKKNQRKNQGDLLEHLKIFVLDEADKLLGEDFRDQIHKILKHIPRDCQVCLFSATYLQDIIELTEKFMNNPVKILVDKEKISVDTIKNYYVDAQYEENKYDILLDLYQKVSVCQAVIFVNSVRKAIELSDHLTREGHAVGTIHSKLNDIERSEVLIRFRKTQTRILVATDIISRGIDVQQVGLVINYDVPIDPEHYIHRVGRSGRYGKLGVAISFVTSHHADVARMKMIEKNYKIKFESLPSLDTINGYLTGMNGYNYIDTSNEVN
jgi:translation initiation factor 4A